MHWSNRLLPGLLIIIAAVLAGLVGSNLLIRPYAQPDYDMDESQAAGDTIATAREATLRRTKAKLRPYVRQFATNRPPRRDGIRRLDPFEPTRKQDRHASSNPAPDLDAHVSGQNAGQVFVVDDRPQSLSGPSTMDSAIAPARGLGSQNSLSSDRAAITATQSRITQIHAHSRSVEPTSNRDVSSGIPK